MKTIGEQQRVSVAMLAHSTLERIVGSGDCFPAFLTQVVHRCSSPARQGPAANEERSSLPSSWLLVSIRRQTFSSNLTYRNFLAFINELRGRAGEDPAPTAIDCSCRDAAVTAGSACTTAVPPALAAGREGWTRSRRRRAGPRAAVDLSCSVDRWFDMCESKSSTCDRERRFSSPLCSLLVLALTWT